MHGVQTTGHTSPIGGTLHTFSVPPLTVLKTTTPDNDDEDKFLQVQINLNVTAHR